MRARRRSTVAITALATAALACWALPGGASAGIAARPGEAIVHPSRHPYGRPEAPASPACDAHFCVHWVDHGIDAPPLGDTNRAGVPGYVQRVLAIADHVHHVENEKLGWREPLGDGALGGGHDKTDIYLTELAGEDVFGYTATDPGSEPTPNGKAWRQSAYLVLDNDYSDFEFPGTEPGRDIKVTLAHEYDHILQYGYDAAMVERDPWFAEASAVWMEDQAYNGIDDYLRYVQHWVKLWSTPLTQSSIKEYGSAVWNEWLAHHYGRSIMRKVWAGAAGTSPTGFAIAAYERAIRAAGPSTFGRDFTRFAAAVAEWRTGEGFRESYLYPDMPRQGTLVLGGTQTRRLLHTTFSLIRVHAGAGAAVELHLKAPEGVAAGLALVGRIGSERHGHVVRSLGYREAGGELTVTLPDPGRFQRITAVVVDADARVSGYDRKEETWDYRGGSEPFRLSGRIVR